MANESRRYFTSSALLFAAAGPPFSQCSGGALPSISLKNAKLEHATCFTCSANERTPLNSPAAGTKSYLDSGIASATPRNCPSVQCRAPPTLSAMFLGTSSCCAAAEIGIRRGRKSVVISQKQRREAGKGLFDSLPGRHLTKIFKFLFPQGKNLI